MALFISTKFNEALKKIMVILAKFCVAITRVYILFLIFLLQMLWWFLEFDICFGESCLIYASINGGLKNPHELNVDAHWLCRSEH